MPSIKIEPHHKELKIENLNTIQTAEIYAWQLVNIRKRKRIVLLVPPNTMRTYYLSRIYTSIELFADNDNVKFSAF